MRQKEVHHDPDRAHGSPGCHLRAAARAFDRGSHPGAVPSPSTGSVGPTGSLIDERVYHTATLLPDGRVLVLGGVSGDGEDSVILASTESFDPATGAFSPGGSLIEARKGHTATLLPDGRVLAIGGGSYSGEEPVTLASAELWDPVSEDFSPAGSLIEDRIGYTASLLPDGRVLVVGGESGPGEVPLASAEVWDPATGAFGPAGSLCHARARHTATPLLDGRVLVIGGNGDGGAYTAVAAAELWGPGSALSACLSASTSATPQTSAPPDVREVVRSDYGVSPYRQPGSARRSGHG